VTWALQWQPQGKIGWCDTQVGPPNHASTLLEKKNYYSIYWEWMK